MFHSARLKLTAWYLLIIMLISLFFSVVIYRVLTAELNRFTRMQQTRIELRWQNTQIFPPPLVIDEELIIEFRKRIIFSLLFINASILIFSGLLSYMLAGKTLQPIQIMMEDQKRFISDASHELRTPITALKTTLEVAQRDKRMTLANAKQLIAENLEDVDRLQQLSDALLELSKFQQHHHQLQSEIQISQLVKTAVKKIQPLAKQKQLTIKTKIDPVTVIGDEPSLQSLLTILLDNAIKYSQAKGTVEINASRRKDLVVIEVIDHGIGIAKKDLQHIFDRFFRADIARSTQKANGYGLGLAIAKKIAEAHRGTIEVSSQLGKGSTFTVKFYSSAFLQH